MARLVTARWVLGRRKHGAVQRTERAEWAQLYGGNPRPARRGADTARRRAGRRLVARWKVGDHRHRVDADRRAPNGRRHDETARARRRPTLLSRRALAARQQADRVPRHAAGSRRSLFYPEHRWRRTAARDTRGRDILRALT